VRRLAPGEHPLTPTLCSAVFPAARFHGVAPKTLRLAAETGEIEGVHPLPDGFRVFSRSELRKPKAQQAILRARQNPKYAAGLHPDQQTLFTSTT